MILSEYVRLFRRLQKTLRRPKLGLGNCPMQSRWMIAFGAVLRGQLASVRQIEIQGMRQFAKRVGALEQVLRPW